eukprot:3306633-Rhodomonas_salina.2
MPIALAITAITVVLTYHSHQPSPPSSETPWRREGVCKGLTGGWDARLRVGAVEVGDRDLGGWQPVRLPSRPGTLPTSTLLLASY